MVCPEIYIARHIESTSVHGMFLNVYKIYVNANNLDNTFFDNEEYVIKKDTVLIYFETEKTIIKNHIFAWCEFN